MSANKTIKALREERELLYAEIRRLQVAAAGTVMVPATSLKELKVSRKKATATFEFSEMERVAQALTGYQVPTHWLFGHESEESMRAQLAELEIDTKHPLVAAALTGSTVTWAKSLAALERGEEGMLETFKRQYLGEFKAEVPDWSKAPPDATHALTKYPENIIWLKLRQGREPAYRWSWTFLKWMNAYDSSADALESKYVVARPVPEEVWSVTGENGSWDYASLAELIRDNYGSREDGTSFGPGLGNGLKVGHTVRRAIVCKSDPAGFLPDADFVTNHMCEMAYQSDAGEWADGYPELDAEAMQAMEKASEPLKAWARRYCQPDFFTVKDITVHELTEEDVRAAGRNPQVRE